MKQRGKGDHVNMDRNISLLPTTVLKHFYSLATLLSSSTLTVVAAAVQAVLYSDMIVSLTGLHPEGTAYSSFLQLSFFRHVQICCTYVFGSRA